jgi:hypothetical protein
MAIAEKQGGLKNDEKRSLGWQIYFWSWAFNVHN